MRDTTKLHAQLTLFLELTETVSTGDQPFADRDGGWGTGSMPPPGHGWCVADYCSEHATRFERRRLVPAWGRR